MPFTKKALTFLFVLFIALGNTGYSQSLQIEIKITVDGFDRPSEIYSYYRSLDHKEVKHGQRFLWLYKNGMLIIEQYRDGKRVNLKSTKMSGWTPDKAK